MPTSNTYIQPQNGWQAVVVAPAFIRISAIPETQPFYVYKGSAPPTSQTGGLLYKRPYLEDVNDTDTFYVRVVNPHDEAVRIDTFWIAGSSGTLGHLLLEDSSGGLLLEDGSGLLAMEN